VALKNSNDDLVKENKQIKFNQEYSEHQFKEEEQKCKDLLLEINSINMQIKEMELTSEKSLKTQESKVREMQEGFDAQRVTINSQDKRLREKEKRLTIQETKIIDL